MRDFLLIGLFLITNTIFAQSLLYIKYDDSQGLENSDINAIVQDSHGFLWLGTMNGLYRCDGLSLVEIIYHDINAEKAVFDLAVGRDRDIWIASENGLTSFNGASFNYFGLNRQDRDTMGSPGLLLAGDEKYYADRSGNIYHVQNKKLQKISDHFFNSNQKIIGWHSAGAGTIWVLSDKGDLYQLSGRNLSGPYKIDTGQKDPPQYIGLRAAENRSLELITDRGILEISTDSLRGNASAKWHYRHDQIRAYFSDSRNNHWIIDDRSLRRISMGDTSRISIPINPDSKILFFEDVEKNVWLSVSGSGLYKFPGDVITRMENELIGNFTPSSYMARGDELWISYFGAGAKILTHGVETGMNRVHGLVSDFVRDIIFHRNEVWFVTARGVTRMSGKNIRHYTVLNGLPDNYCYKAGIDDSGRILIATEQGLAVFENEKFSTPQMDGGASAGRIIYLYHLKDGSVLLIKENRIDVFKSGKVSPFIQHGFLNKEVLNTITEDQFGNFWIGSDMNGLFFFKREDSTLKHVSKELMLPFSRVRTIVPYGDQHICLGTEKGIMYAEINENGEITEFYPCGMEMGYLNFEVNRNASLKIGDKIFVGTSIGTVIFQPEKLSFGSGGPVVNITGLDISFKETDWTNSSQRLDSWFQVPVQPVLNHEQNDLLFHYNGISLFTADQLWYKYRLENYDNAWSQPTRNTSAIYANLAPGSYTFLVQASYDGFNWNDQSTSYTLIIAPPFWKSWWFYLIMISFVLFGFILFNNYRIKAKINQLIAIERLKKEEYSRIQKKVAMDFHDEVGNHLTSISLLIELIKSNDWKIEEELGKLLDKIDDESKNLFRGTKDFIWSIDPANDNLKAVYHNIRDYGMDLFDNSSINFRTQNGKVDMNLIKLPAGFARHIVLIFKEGLNNVLKHAGCRNVYFSIEIEGKDIELKLKDDGQGFCEQDQHHIEEIKKMKYRGAKIRSELIFHSDENLGTEIILKAKI
ncbi:MAG: hypothetical protein KFF73_02390 [Cyclobacteriaceae bacterium]|nr:hypothetical protein [Cyclobacteriaceae bacterium]